MINAAHCIHHSICQSCTCTKPSSTVPRMSHFEVKIAVLAHNDPLNYSDLPPFNTIVKNSTPIWFCYTSFWVSKVWCDVGLGWKLEGCGLKSHKEWAMSRSYWLLHNTGFNLRLLQKTCTCNCTGSNFKYNYLLNYYTYYTITHNTLKTNHNTLKAPYNAQKNTYNQQHCPNLKMLKWVCSYILSLQSSFFLSCTSKKFAFALLCYLNYPKNPTTTP